MNKLLIVATTCALAFAYTPSFASGDAAAGKNKTQVCAACHGADGNSTAPEFPRLAGQNADYLQKALERYKNKTRNNAIMNGFAANLSEQDIEDITAYFSSQKGLVVKY